MNVFQAQIIIFLLKETTLFCWIATSAAISSRNSASAIQAEIHISESGGTIGKKTNWRVKEKNVFSLRRMPSHCLSEKLMHKKGFEIDDVKCFDEANNLAKFVESQQGKEFTKRMLMKSDHLFQEFPAY